MKKMKHFVTLGLACILCLSFSITAFANEAQNIENDKFNLPDDAIVLYEEDDIVLYQSQSESAARKEASTLAEESGVDYESVWLDRSSTSSFKIYCSHSGKVGVTIGIESSSDESWAQITIKRPDGRYLFPKSGGQIRPSDGEVLMRMADGTIGTYTVNYQASTNVGMRIMCWMYNY